MTASAPTTTYPIPFDYALWTEILGVIVTPAGKVDYEILARHRDHLARFVAQLATASPDTTPERFPTPEHALAYWINAYNAFVLAAVIEEYPVRSVWKVHDGQFFVRARHCAGGVLLSLNDIEHRILRGRFREPRIHFALNCASNGCPPMRPQAFVPAGIRETLLTATRQFLASEWNCRIDRDQHKIFVSRLFRMYAEDFAGEAQTTSRVPAGRAAVYCRAHWRILCGARRVCRGLQHLRLGPQRCAPGPAAAAHYLSRERGNLSCAGWGAARDSISTTAISVTAPAPGVRCSAPRRDGTARTPHASWKGPWQPWPGMATSSSTAVSLHSTSDSLRHAMQFLRQRGFQGLFTIYSNGVKARTLIDLLESDPQSEAVLNYSIYLGRDAEPLPGPAKALLEAWGRAHPQRLFSGYKVLYHAGAGAAMVFDQDREPTYHGHQGCVLCFPVLKATGEFHACPLAIENPAPHFRLGDVTTPASVLFAHYRQFRTWATTVLDPAAQARQITSCAMCQQHLDEIPDYRSL